MKLWITILSAAMLMPMSASAANAPSQQKVVRDVTIKAEPAKVWEVVKDFGGLHKWHPAAASTELKMMKDESGTEVQHRLITLKGGGTILEKLVGSTDAEMKLEYRIVESVLPVSGYRAIMQVKAGPGAGESTVTWTGRFYNKANAVDAKPGEDNATAVKAIEGVYDAGLPALNKLLEQ